MGWSGLPEGPRSRGHHKPGGRLRRGRDHPAVDGLTEVHLIGGDTPETSHPTYGERPYGQQDKKFTVSRQEGEQVALEFNVEKVDP